LGEKRINLVQALSPNRSIGEIRVGEARTNEAAALVISAKMAKALADTWRSRILMELSVRPMSPSQFVNEVGGELDHIGRCFRQLANWDYIEIAETLRGGHRRGAVEHVYRSIHRAHFDTSTWEGLPRNHRDQFSGSILESYVARIAEAIEAGTFDDEIDRHLSWDAIPLDRTAWNQLGARLNDVLHSLPELEIEAMERMAGTDEEPIPTTVGLAAFRSPVSGELLGVPPRQRRDELGPAPSAEPFAISAKMAKAVANKWRSRILMELRVRPMSATQFVREVGGGRVHISRCFRQLAEWDYIEVFETRTGGERRGGIEKVYRLKQRAHFDTQTWEQLPRFLRDEFSSAILQSYFARITEAIEAETFDAETDRHLSWDGVALDRIAWAQLTERLDQLLDWLPELEQEAADRIAASEEEPIPTTVGLAAFRSPKSSQIDPRAREQALKEQAATL
jgi:hypothetical protein